MSSLGDGSVAPHFLETSPATGVPQKLAMAFGNVAMRVGEVKEVIPTDDERNISKVATEYNVEVYERNGSGPAARRLYLSCFAVNKFGGAADRERYSLRKDDGSTDKSDNKDPTGNGSKVLLLCINGQTSQAVILGGVVDTFTAPDHKEPAADGHHYRWRFNGFEIRVNDDGSADFVFNGPQKNNGELADGDTKDGDAPTIMHFGKRGGWSVRTKGDSQYHYVDHEHGITDQLIDQKWKVTVNGTSEWKFGDSFFLDADKNYEIKAKGLIGLTSTKDDINFSAGTDVNISRGGKLKVGVASDPMVKGKVWRQNEQALHRSLVGDVKDCIIALGTMVAAANGPMTIPIYGPIVAGPILGQGFLQLAQKFGSMIASILQYEGKAQQQLSQKNFLD